MTIEIMIDVAGQLAAGFAPGLVTSAAFFAGLALGIRTARAARYPTMVLLASFGARLALLLGMGFWVAQLGVYEAVGFAAAFVVLRIVLVRMAARSTTTTIVKQRARQGVRQGGLNAADTR